MTGRNTLNPNPKFAAIIFDMDGTLVDSEIIWQAVETEMFRDIGIDYTDEVRQMIIGLRLDEMFTKLQAHYGLQTTVPELMLDLETRMIQRIPLHVKAKPGAQAIIDYAAARDIPYCIASSSSMAVIEATVHSQGWRELIARLYTADAVPNGKPAPDVYLYAARELGVNPADCLALEDSVNGAKAAVAAGMTCYAVPDYHADPEKLRAVTPYVFKSLDEVLAKLQA
jgi:HAD superfamily hydrolase (TIGR01509 family)